ncbi:DAK2 domain protein [Corynebacterium ciconiae DSM 44920]|uniref:DAK2 domain-containing protein n=1 Tax=Corynebacterium ciconiae TaxID=227319 RepID=UPI0003804E25|nr:DAK2 domain-containing protein [Corynebacterium ciconiae]WKD61068.1 DAK2 domain protein [Corynebacterium ciconiae DSM 44920]
MTPAPPTTLGPSELHSWARAAASQLAARRAEINALNVFPVPDSDTGSNMAHTMEAALDHLETLIDASSQPLDVRDIATALAQGSVRGARGNSGMVLSQVLRAVALAAAGGGIDGRMVRTSLNSALAMVNEAINEPVEGTVLTVLRAAAVAADATDSCDLGEVVLAATAAAQRALDATPSQLDVLREAGVVDAGGAGLVVLLETLAQQIDPDVPVRDLSTITPHRGAGTLMRSSTYLEVMFCYEGADIDDLYAALQPLGDSLVLARAEQDQGRIHIHSDEPGRVIETAYAHAGEISQLHLEALPEPEPVQVSKQRRIIIAVCPRGELAELYEASGAMVVAPAAAGEDTVKKIGEAISAVGAKEVSVLPNGMLSKRELVSTELAAHASGVFIQLVPTSQLVVGLAAIAVHDPRQPLVVDCYAMSEAASAMRTSYISSQDSHYVAHMGANAASTSTTCERTHSLEEAVERACEELLRPESELVTVLLSDASRVEQLSATLHNGVLAQRNIELSVYPAQGMNYAAEIGVE